MTITDQPQGLQNASDRQGTAAPEISGGAQQAAASRRQRSIHSGRRGNWPIILTIPTRRVTPREAENRSRHLRLHRRRLCRSCHCCTAGGSRHQGCPHHREGRRFRRHLVLEPLSRRAMRHGFDGLHAAARRNRAHAVGEIRARAGDPRALPAHRQAIWPLRQRAVPYPGGRAWSGTRQNRAGSFAPAAAMPSRHSSSAWAPGRCTCQNFPASRASSSFKGHSFHTSRWDYDYTGGDPSWRADGKTRRQARRHHRHRCDIRSVRAVSGARLQGALRLPAPEVAITFVSFS